MEKFNFLKLAKFSCLIFGLSSFILSSCTKDENSEPYDDDLNVPVLTVGDFSVTYPENNSFKAWDQGEKSLKIAGQSYTFSVYLTMDTLSNDVRIYYYTQIDPSTAKASDADAFAEIFKSAVYCEDAGHELTSFEKVSLGGHDAVKLTAKQFWCKDQNGKKVECEIYKERYVFFDEGTQKLYSVEIEMPCSLTAKRQSELYGIVSSLRIKKN